MVNLQWDYGNHWKKDHRATGDSSVIKYGCHDKSKCPQCATETLINCVRRVFLLGAHVREHFTPTTVIQGCGQAHLPLESAFDSLFSDWITSQNIVWKWICRLTLLKREHLLRCEGTVVFLWSLFKGKFLLSNSIGMILLDHALSLSIWGGYSQSKTTKTHIQQTPKTFAMWEGWGDRG